MSEIDLAGARVAYDPKGRHHLGRHPANISRAEGGRLRLSRLFPPTTSGRSTRCSPGTSTSRGNTPARPRCACSDGPRGDSRSLRHARQAIATFPRQDRRPGGRRAIRPRLADSAGQDPGRSASRDFDAGAHPGRCNFLRKEGVAPRSRSALAVRHTESRASTATTGSSELDVPARRSPTGAPHAGAVRDLGLDQTSRPPVASIRGSSRCSTRRPDSTTACSTRLPSLAESKVDGRFQRARSLRCAGTSRRTGGCLELEGLREWLPPREGGITTACGRAGLDENRRPGEPGGRPIALDGGDPFRSVAACWRCCDPAAWSSLEPGGGRGATGSSSAERCATILPSWCRLERHGPISRASRRARRQTNLHFIGRGRVSASPYATDAAALRGPIRTPASHRSAARGRAWRGPRYPFTLNRRDFFFPRPPAETTRQLYDQATLCAVGTRPRDISLGFAWRPCAPPVERAVGQGDDLPWRRTSSRRSYVPSKFVARAESGLRRHRDCFLATQMMDESRHNRRVSLRGARRAPAAHPLGVSSVTDPHASLLSLLELEDFTEAAFPVVGGSAKAPSSILLALQSSAMPPDEVTAEIARRTPCRRIAPRSLRRDARPPRASAAMRAGAASRTDGAPDAPATLHGVAGCAPRRSRMR